MMFFIQITRMLIFSLMTAGYFCSICFFLHPSHSFLPFFRPFFVLIPRKQTFLAPFFITNKAKPKTDIVSLSRLHFRRAGWERRKEDQLRVLKKSGGTTR